MRIALSRRQVTAGIAVALLPTPGWGEDDCPQRWSYAEAVARQVPLADAWDGVAVAAWGAAISAEFQLSPRLVIVRTECPLDAMAVYDEKSIPHQCVIINNDSVKNIIRRYTYSNIVIQGIMAHECWHLDQFRMRRKNPGNLFEFEADSMAGYYLGLLRRENDFNVDAVVRWLAARTPLKTRNNTPASHGTSAQREECLMWGFEVGFTQGRKPMADLRAISERLARAA